MDMGELPVPEGPSYWAVHSLVPVAAAFWGALERSRWGPAVAAVAGLVAAVLMVRLHQIWPVIRV